MAVDIPQFVVIRDQANNTYKHPIVRYVFEDEPLPDVPKDNLIVVDFDESAQVANVDSYSPYFQVTQCRLEHGTVTDEFDSGTSMCNLMVEGVSAPKANEVIENLQPVRNVDSLKEMIFNFRKRNELVKSVIAPAPASSFIDSPWEQ